MFTLPTIAMSSLKRTLLSRLLIPRLVGRRHSGTGGYVVYWTDTSLGLIKGQGFGALKTFGGRE